MNVTSTYTRQHRLFTEAARTFELTVGAVRAAVAIAERGGEAQMGTVAADLECASGTASEALGALYDRGFLSGDRHRGSRVPYWLTEKGWELVEIAVGERQAVAA